ncbi:sigma factor-like helix-turn-helix DNA-binding protein [Mesobacillus zeae]|nr:sigma factor-like helix-turn-helix DNA-binding protein [Mesobacillus zeae]
MHIGERRLAERYALDSTAGVKLLLSEYHALIGRQYQGDYDAVVLLTDMATAIDQAGLTDRQRQALTLVYVDDLTQAKAGEAMGGLAKDAVNHLLDRAIEAISEVYWYWSRHDEGYTILSTKGESE